MIYALVSTGGGELSEEQKAVADINGDGLVDSSDRRCGYTATAQANGLNTEQYLTELFSQPAGTILLPFNT